MEKPTERHPPRNSATKWIARLGLAGVTVLAAVASYLHALAVVQAADGTGRVSYFVPALADLLIATASANILDASRDGAQWPRLPVASVVVGVGVTLGMNVTAGSPHVVPAWLVNAWPPVAFVLALESFAGHIRRGRDTQAPPAVPATPRPFDTADTCPHMVAGNVAEAVRTAWEHERDCLGGKPTYTALGDRFGVDRRKVAELVTPGGSDRGRDGAGGAVPPRSLAPVPATGGPPSEPGPALGSAGGSLNGDGRG